MLIYRAVNKTNGKSYVGQTVGSLNKRKSEHISSALRNGNNMYFGCAIRKHGPDNFTWTTLHDDITTIEDLNQLEIFYIGYYDTFENGYNLTLGGGGSIGWIPSEETKRKISESHKGMYHSKAAKKKMSIARKGKHFSKEHKRKISEANRGEKGNMFGKHHSDETRKKMSETMKGQNIGKNNPNAVEIIIGNNRFDTLRQAGIFIGMTPSAIRRRILHKTKWLDYSYVK